MTQSASDQLQRFLFDDTQVRGEQVLLEQSYQSVLARHDYPAVVERLLGELLAACALLTATIKLDGVLSLEVRGDGPLTLLMAESNPGSAQVAQRLRAIARFDEQALAGIDDAGLAALIGAGQVVITLDPRGGQRYQGIVALEHATLSGCLEAYFARSEQLPTRLWLAAGKERAAGLLVQKLPADGRQTDIDAWERIGALADTITVDELLTLAPERLLYRLFHEERARLFEPRPLVFGCTCSRERFAQALHRLGAEELRAAISELGRIDTQCHFCNTHYLFDAADVEALLQRPDASSPTLH